MGMSERPRLHLRLKASLCLKKHFHQIWPIAFHTTGMELLEEVMQTFLCL